jgi:hypothetical protein
MTLRGIGVGDIVLVEHKGRRFHAEVVGKTRGELSIKPLDRRHTWQRCSAFEVVDHWRHTPRLPANPRARSRPGAGEARRQEALAL